MGNGLSKNQFNEWNVRLLRSFFSEASKDEAVFLRVDVDILDQIGQDIGGDKGFLKAVKAGPKGVIRSESFVERIESLRQQRIRQKKRHVEYYTDPEDLDSTYQGVDAPPYLPYLAALVRCDTLGNQAYYATLTKDLGLEHFSSNEMAQTEKVWQDLEKWTKSVNGQFGWFESRTLGKLSRLGKLRAQNILNNKDLERLVYAFLQSGSQSGHELSEEQYYKILNNIKSDSGYYSKSFQEALEREEFNEPVHEAISTTFADWDGTVPPGSRTQSTSEKDAVNSEYEVNLCLKVINPQDPLVIEPAWRVPALQDAGSYRLKHKTKEWSGNFCGTDGSTSKKGSADSHEIWGLAKHIASESVTIDLEYELESDYDKIKVQLPFSERKLWILEPVFDNGIELREGALPGNGPAYLLTPPENSGGLRSYLARENPDHQIITAKGVPNDWLFVCILECSKLNESQRLLPDGQDKSHPRPRVIRFIGGRSIQRAYRRLYLHYDLPSIVIDAPEGAELKCCSDAIQLEEYNSIHNEDDSTKLKFNFSKRYRIELTDSRSASYKLELIMDDTILGSARLKIAGFDGEAIGIGQSYSLDRFGLEDTTQDGLSGILSSNMMNDLDDSEGQDDILNLPLADIGNLFTFDDKAFGAHEKFLDSLAQSGSLSYGVARDQLLRLFEYSEEEIIPAFVLFELRSRGHLEISTTNKGYISRIHFVEPTVYQLPMTCSGKHVYGVTGTLRLRDWQIITKEIPAQDLWVVYHKNDKSRLFKSLRLVSDDRDYVQLACDEYDLQLSTFPANAVAKWSADINKIEETTFINSMESIGNTQDCAMRFHSGKGLFSTTPQHIATELWKVRDLDTGMDNLYVLFKDSKYAYIRDSRWGIWLALNAFAEWIENETDIKDVLPIPVTYVIDNRTLWLPARISLPCILERALVLCSGNSPSIIGVTTKVEDGGRLNLFANDETEPLVSVNQFYTQMAEGKWLAYPYVPRAVASTVVRKLGAKLDAI